MIEYSFTIVIGILATAWLTTRIVNARHERSQEITDLHKRIDDAERWSSETVGEVQRTFDDRLSRVQEELIREYAALIQRISTLEKNS